MKTGTHNLGENAFGTKLLVKPHAGTSGFILDAIDKHGNRSQLLFSGGQAALLKDILSADGSQ